MRHLFLYIVFKQHKFLFILFISFIIGQSFFSYKQVENFPFFNYGMYSAPLAQQDTFNIPRIYINQKPLNIYKHYDLGTAFVVYNIYYYYHFRQCQSQDPILETIDHRFATRVSSERLEYIKKMLSNDQTATDQFLQWLYRYLSQSWEEPITRLEFNEQSYCYTASGLKLLNSQQLVKATINVSANE